MSVTYNIYRNGGKIASGIQENTYTDTGLDPNTSYQYQVSSVNEFGESELSKVLTVTTEDVDDTEEEEEEKEEEN